MILGHTRLPDGFQLTISLRIPNGMYIGQSHAEVRNGHFKAGPFSQNGTDYPVGLTYVVEVSSPAAMFQPDSVKAVIGAYGQNLAGPFVSATTVLGQVDTVVKYSQMFVIAQ